jgi:DNA-binding IclR family transcriptional regulator
MSVTTRVVSVLERLAAAEEPPTHAELARATGVSKSTLTRILAELGDLDYLAAIDRRYAAGSRLLALGYNLTRQLGVPPQAPEDVHQLLERLVHETGETAAFSIEIGRTANRAGEVFSLDHVESPSAIRFVPNGLPVPIVISAAGFAMLAFTGRSSSAIPPETLVRRTSETLVELDAIDVELEATRARGYARNFDGALEGLSTIAALWPDPQAPIGAISICGPTTRMRPAEPVIWDALRAALQH